MKCKILHESKGRLRVHLFCGKMSLDNADVLEYYLRAVNGVTDVSVYDRTCDAVIVFTDRKAVLKALAAFAFEKAQKMCLVPDHTSRKLNREFEDNDGNCPFHFKNIYPCSDKSVHRCNKVVEIYKART